MTAQVLRQRVAAAMTDDDIATVEWLIRDLSHDDTPGNGTDRLQYALEAVLDRATAVRGTCETCAHCDLDSGDGQTRGWCAKEESFFYGTVVPYWCSGCPQFTPREEDDSWGV